MGEAWAAVWDAFLDTLGAIPWGSPWTWLAIVAGLMVLGAANR